MTAQRRRNIRLRRKRLARPQRRARLLPCVASPWRASQPYARRACVWADLSGLRRNDGPRSFLCERACAVADCAGSSTAQMCVGGWVGALGDRRCSSLSLKSRIRPAGRSKERNRDIILWFTQTSLQNMSHTCCWPPVVKGKDFNLKQTGDAFKGIT